MYQSKLDVLRYIRSQMQLHLEAGIKLESLRSAVLHKDADAARQAIEDYEQIAGKISSQFTIQDITDIAHTSVRSQVG